MEDRLAEVVGPEHVITDPGRLLAYESDGLTAYRSSPRAVVLPASAQEVAEVVRLLHAEGVPVVPRGAGTGLSGGALAAGDAVVLGTARMNRVLALDPENRLARVQPGVVNATLTELAGRHGLRYAPDPSSQSACTLGGNVAENSGGPHCLKYGVTSRYVLGLQAVLAGGRVARLGGAGGDPLSSMDLVGLVVGSEGCFCVVTEIELGLIPVAESAAAVLGVFETVAGAGAAVSAIMASGLLPAALEIVDAETIRAVEASAYAAGYPTDAGAVLVVEFDGPAAGLEADASAAAAFCLEAGAREVRRARDESERAALWKGRKKAFGAMGRIAPDLLVQDATVPRTRLPRALAEIAEIGDRYRLRIANVFHAGDGNLHPNVLFDRSDEDELGRVERASKEIMALCVEAGGTITGEHGVGADKSRYMPLVHGPGELRAMEEAKRAFDPEELFNPGKVLPDAGSFRAEGARRRDPPARPSAVPRPAAAARAAGGWGVPGQAAEEVLEPKTEEEIGDILVWAAAEGLTVLPTGGGRHRQGSLPDGPYLLLSLARFDELLRYEPADLTLTVGAGKRAGALAKEMAPHGQWLPFDPPHFETRSLGGLAALGDGGPLANHYGAVRNHVLGARVVCGDGGALDLGGQVVKNVAGFDLLRPLVGGLGAAVFVSVTLRAFPLPEADHSLFFEVEGVGSAAGLAQALASGCKAAASVTVTDGSNCGAYRIRTRFHGRNELVEAEKAKTLGSFASNEVRLSEDPTDADRLAGSSLADPVVFTFFSLPAAFSATMLLAQELRDAEATEARLTADARAGSVRVELPPLGQTTPSEARALRERCQRAGIALRIEGVPGVPAWNPANGETARLAGKIRRIFDPWGVLWDPRASR